MANKPVPISEAEMKDAKAWALSAKATKDARGKSVRVGLKKLKQLLK